MNIRWHKYFMDVAELTANSLSKDSNTKVGAVLVKNRKILSIGYNGAPRGFDDSKVPKNNSSKKLEEQKNAYMVHAELNAILNYEGDLEDLKNSTLYVTISPCFECAKVLAQLNIESVIYKEKYHRKDLTIVSDIIFDECGIEQISIEELLNNEDRA